MEYERCDSCTSSVIFAAVVIAIILVVYFIMMRKENASDRVDQVIGALNETQKEKGTIVDFKGRLGDKSFSALKYMHLTDLYRQDKVTKESVSKILADNSL